MRVKSMYNNIIDNVCHTVSLNLVNDLQLTRKSSNEPTSHPHQILADKNPDKHGEEDAADEPEDSEGIKVL